MDAAMKTVTGSLRAATLSFLMCISVFSGCKHANCDLVEAELRSKERQIDELQDEVRKRDTQVDTLEKQLDQHERTAAKGGIVSGTGVHVKNVTLGRRTGGYDLNYDSPGDEAVQLVLEPRDLDDQVVKAPGSLHVELYEIDTQGFKNLLSTWDVDQRKLRQSWESAWIGGSAYKLLFPWKSLPNSDKLRVVVQFTTLDGMKFEADRDFTIKPPDREKSPKSRRDGKPAKEPSILELPDSKEPKLELPPRKEERAPEPPRSSATSATFETSARYTPPIPSGPPAPSAEVNRVYYSPNAPAGAAWKPVRIVPPVNARRVAE